MVNIEHLKKVVEGFTSKVNTFSGPRVDLLPDPDPSEECNYIPIKPQKVADVLRKYGFPCTCEDYYIGPTVTTYIIKPISYTFTRIKNINPYDIARELKVKSLRVSLSNSGVEVEIENPKRFNISFKELFLNIPNNFKLPIILGENSYGFRRYIDLAEMPHLLIAGRTGSGKSVFLNTTIISLMANLQPEELKLVLVDPKKVEFTAFDNNPYLYCHPLINEVAAKYTLIDLVKEMDRRYELLREANVKKLSDYNEKATKKLPYIVIIIDEYADLLYMSDSKDKKEIENCVIRLAQKARAAGMHLIIATQKPLTQILTSVIKSNIPARVSFAVCSSMDSKVILDQKGAEELLGNGDMLFLDPKGNRTERIQAPYLSDNDIAIILNKG